MGAPSRLDPARIKERIAENRKRPGHDGSPNQGPSFRRVEINIIAQSHVTKDDAASSDAARTRA